MLSLPTIEENNVLKFSVYVNKYQNIALMGDFVQSFVWDNSSNTQLFLKLKANMKCPLSSDLVPYKSLSTVKYTSNALQDGRYPNISGPFVFLHT